MPMRSSLFPYTTLFRSERRGRVAGREGDRRRGRAAARLGRRAALSAGRQVHAEGRTVRRARHRGGRSEEHTSELQSHVNLVCRLLLEKKKLLIMYIISE